MIGLLSNWFKRKDGATAMEFSMLLLPYMTICLGIVELSLMYMTASVVEGATDTASRLIRTGQIQQGGGDPETVFRDALCEATVILVDCNEMVVEAVPIDSYGDFSDATFDGDGNLVPQDFDLGGSNQKLIVRVAYRYTMITPLVGPILNGEDGSTLFMTTLVMQSEPYEFQGGV